MSNNNNAIPSPEEWLEDYDPDLKKWIKDGGHTTLYDLKNMLTSYADHVAALVHRNTRHRAIEILNEEVADYVESEDQMGTIIGDKAGQRIMNIPLRAVYPEPAGEENREEEKKITFYEVYDFRAMYDRESAVCYESMIDTLEEAKKAAEGYGGGVIYECTGEVDDTTTPHTITETSARKKMQVIPK